MAHQSAGVNEVNRNLTVVPSAPFNPTQNARTAAAAVTVPFNYSSGTKQGGP